MLNRNLTSKTKNKRKESQNNNNNNNNNNYHLRTEPNLSYCYDLSDITKLCLIPTPLFKQGFLGLPGIDRGGARGKVGPLGFAHYNLKTSQHWHGYQIYTECITGQSPDFKY